jgi:hypothetical protein
MLISSMKDSQIKHSGNRIKPSGNRIKNLTARSISLATDLHGQLLLSGRDELISTKQNLHAALVELRSVGKEFRHGLRRNR